MHILGVVLIFIYIYIFPIAHCLCPIAYCLLGGMEDTFWPSKAKADPVVPPFMASLLHKQPVVTAAELRNSTPSPRSRGNQ